MKYYDLFLYRSGIGGVRSPTNSIPLDDPIMKVLEYEMVAYLFEIPDLKYPFSSHPSELQKFIFKRIH